VRLLLVVVGDASPETIRLALGVAPQQVHVVVPTVVSPLDWLANADDAGRARAEARARAAEKALHGLVAVTSGVGPIDPVDAAAEALAEFPATVIVVTGAAADADLDLALGRFGLPVRRAGPPPGRAARINREIRELAGGRNPGKVLALIVGMNAGLVVVGLVLSLLALLVLWAIGAY
jgi:hypothetical protein